uniref:ARAD1D32120p n=1 Tax=Blastobotrys adeninivorans TaxID=409370 RepID=A0A060TBI6_BLAAD
MGSMGPLVHPYLRTLTSLCFMIMEGDWTACPYQRYFEEQNRRRRDDHMAGSGSESGSASSSSPTSTLSGGSTASTNFESRDKVQNDVQDTSQHEVVFCEEPQEMPSSPLESGRPKLSVLTKYIGGF